MKPLFYNSEDGGQFNVPVVIIHNFRFHNMNFHIIAGENLSSDITLDGVGVLLVKAETVTDNKLASVTQLHR